MAYVILPQNADDRLTLTICAHRLSFHYNNAFIGRNTIYGEVFCQMFYWPSSKVGCLVSFFQLQFLSLQQYFFLLRGLHKCFRVCDMIIIAIASIKMSFFYFQKIFLLILVKVYLVIPYLPPSLSLFLFYSSSVYV